MAFWNAFEGHPSMESGLEQQMTGYPTHVIPLGCHGDGVPTVGVGKIWSKLQLCFSWTSFLKNGAAKACSLLIWSVLWLE